MSRPPWPNSQLLPSEIPGTVHRARQRRNGLVHEEPVRQKCTEVVSVDGGRPDPAFRLLIGPMSAPSTESMGLSPRRRG